MLSTEELAGTLREAYLAGIAHEREECIKEIEKEIKSLQRAIARLGDCDLARVLTAQCIIASQIATSIRARGNP